MYIMAVSFASALLLLLSSFDLYAASFLTIIYNLFLSVLFCFLLYLWKVFYRFAGMPIALFYPYSCLLFPCSVYPFAFAFRLSLLIAADHYFVRP